MPLLSPSGGVSSRDKRQFYCPFGDWFEFVWQHLTAHCRGDDRRIDAYSQRALSRIWQAIRFLWSLTMMMHRFPGASEYERRMQDSELALL